jgi:hypothetical protein
MFTRLSLLSSIVVGCLTATIFAKVEKESKIDCPCKNQPYWKAVVDGISDNGQVVSGSCGSYNGTYVVGPVVEETQRWDYTCGPRGGATCSFSGIEESKAVLQWYPEKYDVKDSAGRLIPNGLGGVWVLTITAPNATLYLAGSDWRCDGSNVMQAVVSDNTGCCSCGSIKATVSPTSTDCRGRKLRI